jgi:mannose-6-phosphate isomerase-like protein (cupin superfamily)
MKEARVDAVNLAEKLALFDDRWAPKIVAEMNGHKIALVKVQGEFVWHEHAQTDDFFLVLSGRLAIDLPDATVELGPGELVVVPRGVQHRPRAAELTELLLIEPLGTANTGDAPSDRTAPEERL